MASFGVPVQRYTNYLHLLFKVASALDRETASVYVERFRDPVVARAGRDAYRTFLLREVPRAARHPEKRRATVPIRALYGVNDAAIHESWTSPENAFADDFTLEKVDDTSHFIMEERPDLLRARLIAFAEETSTSGAGPVL
jgi:pimeloyl-ACP methyl ester carboxylesterase